MLQTFLLPLARRGVVNVGAGERALSGLVAWKLVRAGLRRRSIAGLAIAGAGAWLLRRAAKGHCPVYEKLGVVLDRDDGSGWSRPVKIGASTAIHRPRAAVAAFFRDQEAVARALGEIEFEPGALDAPSTWTLKLPGGRRASSRVRVRDRGDEGLAWETAAPSAMRHSGLLRFLERGGETIVVLEASWHAPAAGLAAGANLWARTALRRIRALLEAGEVPVARPVSARKARAVHARGEAPRPFEPPEHDDPVDEAGLESFPASDPPSWTPGETKAPRYDEKVR